MLSRWGRPGLKRGGEIKVVVGASMVCGSWVECWAGPGREEERVGRGGFRCEEWQTWSVWCPWTACRAASTAPGRDVV
jgi:hypothetical protein